MLDRVLEIGVETTIDIVDAEEGATVTTSSTSFDNQADIVRRHLVIIVNKRHIRPPGPVKQSIPFITYG